MLTARKIPLVWYSRLLGRPSSMVEDQPRQACTVTPLNPASSAQSTLYSI